MTLSIHPDHRPDGSSADTPAWHRLDPDEVLERLGTGDAGLDPAEAQRRLAADGPNELVDRGSKHPARILWDQVRAVMVVILIFASLLSLVLGKFLEAGAIGAIVVLFVLLGFVQEYRAEQAIAALRKLAVPTVRVTRAGRATEVPAAELVVGDVVHLEAGSVVPADVRLVECANLRVQEATLTGESEPVDKRVEALDEDDPPLGDRVDMAYSGTEVTFGRAIAVVVATGMDTELGRIAELLQDVRGGRTPLQHRLDRVGKQLALLGVVVAGIVVLMGALAGEPAADLVLTAISVAVAVIPEGLPAVVTFTLAIGAQRMLRRHALIRRLPAVETLGSVTTICSDKTGTLTENRMTVTVIDVPDHRVEREPHGPLDDHSVAGRELVASTLAAASLANDATAELGDAPDATLSTIGDPTETSLLHAAHDAGIDVIALRRAAPRLGEHPFESERKRMSTVHGPLGGAVPALGALDQERPVAFVKGAVDGLLPRVSEVWTDDGPVTLDDVWRDRIEEANEHLARQGTRVLGVAFRHVDHGHDATDPDDTEQDLVLLGLIGIIDPPRREVADAVATCRRAGIRPVMITGDHPLTARAIAVDLGITETDSRVVTGSELAGYDDATLDDVVRTVSVFARVSPEHKLRIVDALQRQGHVVSMTGDGVNDAPALKRADIGVAMGITGTDVSKEASDMVLRDDNFATIVAAVEEGRVIYDNLRRFVSFAVAGNLGKIIVMLAWPVPLLIAGDDLGSAIALLPLQLLWLNLMTDGLLGLSMGVEPAERTVMRRPPNDPGSGLWSDGLGLRTAWVGTFIGAVALTLGLVYHAADRVEWQTMMFTSLAFLQVFQAFGTRSTRESLRSIGWASNRLMIAIAAVVVGLQLAAIYTPLREFLDLEPLGAGDLGLCVASGVVLLALVESAKAISRRRDGSELTDGTDGTGAGTGTRTDGVDDVGSDRRPGATAAL